MVNSLILSCLIVSVYAGIQAVQINDENRLAKHLLRQYKRIGRRGRPVEKNSQTWNVSLSLMLNNIQDVDFASQTIEVLMWQKLQWKDYCLKWSKSDFDVSSIGLSPTDIIMPDVVLYNAASETKALNPDEQLVVFPTGDVYHVHQVRQKSLCTMQADSTNITCTLKYGSWTHPQQKMNLTLGRENVDLSMYQLNPYWKLATTSATMNVNHYDCCPEVYVDLTFNITLTRR